MIGSLAALSCAPAIRRRLSIVSIHSIFPATLYRFQLQRESGLYDKRLQAYDAEVEDALEIADDGMVYPGITNTGMACLQLLPFIAQNCQFRMEPSSCQIHTSCKN